MKAFLSRFAPFICGVLMGYDRLIFRGTLRNLSYTAGLQHYLWANRIPFKHFQEHSTEVTRRLVEASQRQAEVEKRPIVYLKCSSASKEEAVRDIRKSHPVAEGLICILRCVEPCMSFQINKNYRTRLLEIHYRPRQCMHLYHCLMHPVFGYMHVRLQTWFPFRMNVYINGREWLARQMDKLGFAYRRRDNSFTWLEDFAKAQALMHEQLKVNWPKALDALAQQVQPLHQEIFAHYPSRYYWSALQTEYATDLLYRRRADQQDFYRRLVRHGITTYGAAEVLRFLGRKVTAEGKVPGQFKGEITSDVRTREEGTRIRHSVDGNSLKSYDKGPNLRIEMTITRPEDFKVYRRLERNPDGPRAWRAMRRGVVDMPRRAEVSRAATDRYLEAAAAITSAQPLSKLAKPLCEATEAPLSAKGKRQGKRVRKVRALNPLSAQDSALLQAANHPIFLENGLRNPDLCALLYPQQATSDDERRRRSAKVTRQLRLLRAHGLIKKIAHTHRYQVTPHGRIAMTALLAARDASVDALTQNAA
jgi:hypothetical protein